MVGVDVSVGARVMIPSQPRALAVGITTLDAKTSCLIPLVADLLPLFLPGTRPPVPAFDVMVHASTNGTALGSL